MGYELAIIINLLGVSALLVLISRKIKGELALIQPLFIGVAYWLLIGCVGISLELINMADETDLYAMYLPFYNTMVYVGYFIIAMYILFVFVVQTIQWLGGRKKVDVRM